MDSYEMPDDDEVILERWIIRWGLLGVIAGLVMLNVGIFYLWRYALSFFYPGA
jgi:hypothetical protein